MWIYCQYFDHHQLLICPRMPNLRLEPGHYKTVNVEEVITSARILTCHKPFAHLRVKFDFMFHKFGKQMKTLRQIYLFIQDSDHSQHTYILLWKFLKIALQSSTSDHHKRAPNSILARGISPNNLSVQTLTSPP